MKFRKKPIVVDAVQYFPGVQHPAVEIVTPHGGATFASCNGVRIQSGWWVVDQGGVVGAWPDDLFKAHFESVVEKPEPAPVEEVPAAEPPAKPKKATPKKKAAAKKK